MNNSKIHLFTSLDNLERVNERFAKVKIRIAYEGKNRNNSYISRETFEQAIPTLKYVPVVGYYLEDEEMFDGHTEKLEIVGDELSWKSMTKPYGVVTEEEPFWEEVKSTNGEIKHYLTCYAMLWVERYPELKGIKSGDFSQSMEIICNNGYWSEEDNLYHIKDFTFDSLCILQKQEPCFEDSKITLNFSKEVFEQEYKTMIKELKEYTFSLMKGGDTMKCIKCSVEHELENKEDNIEEFICNACKEEDKSNIDKFELSFDDIKENLRKLVSVEKEAYYWVIQTFSDYFVYQEETYKDSNYEVKFYKQNYALEGSTVSLAGDKKEVFARFITQTEIDKLEQEKIEYENQISTLKAGCTDLTIELEDLKSNYNQLKKETEELQEYKSNVEFEKHKAEVDEMLAKYSELETINGYDELTKEKYAVNIEELEKAIKVFAFDNGAILTKKNNKKNFNKEISKIPVYSKGIEEISEAEKRYGLGISKYITK